MKNSFKYFIRRICWVLACLGCAPEGLVANEQRDMVIAAKPHTNKDRRLDYSFELLGIALEATRGPYGDYDLVRSPLPMFRERQYRELHTGNLLNVMISPPKLGWEGKVTRVKFPLQKGVASFRLALVTKKNKDLLENAVVLDDFRQFTIGVNNHWSTTQVLRSHSMNVVVGESYLSLFDMLRVGRFQLFPRGLNEIHREYDDFKQEMPELVIEKHTAMVMYLPSYFYVSPETPQIAERLEVGLRIASRMGAYDKVFDKYFGSVVARAQLDKRRLIFLENGNLSPDMMFEDMPYLLPFFRDLKSR
ncbi:hypothetical protein [Teredinibacter franksiae]|uniref:hypothetical protein n=1 Tax=Teredinibacter franksiae TaxID=2761453 RepID=UPI001626D813|nr:hypothetical protein [Teredinibacter franksiae]